MANCLTTFKVAGVRDDFPAFAHFGGMPKVLVIDNLRAAVTQADWFDPELNPKVQSFCRHYGAGLRQPGYPRPLVRVSPGRLASMGPGFVSPDIAIISCANSVLKKRLRRFDRDSLNLSPCYRAAAETTHQWRNLGNI
jgi:hypothetical protein